MDLKREGKRQRESEGGERKLNESIVPGELEGVRGRLATSQLPRTGARCMPDIYWSE